MPMHIVEPNGIITVKHARERSFRYDLPPHSFPKSLEAEVERNYSSIASFQQAEDNVKYSGEWDNFLSYLRTKGVSESSLEYISSDDKNYIAGSLPREHVVAATVPAHSTLTYIVPNDFESKVSRFASQYGMSAEQAETIVYLHEAMHNIIHDYRRDSHRPTSEKEAEVEAALEEYFSCRAANAESESERQYYQKMADVCQTRLQRHEAAFENDELGDEAGKEAVMEEELDEEGSEAAEE